MDNLRHSSRCAPGVLFSAALLLFAGCRKKAETAEPAEPVATTNAAPAAASGSPRRQHRMFMNGISPLIVSVSPETIGVSQGHAQPQRFSVTYEIGNAEKVKKAAIAIRTEGGGELQRFDVPVAPSAQVEVFLDATSYDLGPTVRFRVRCPAGDSDWYTMGILPVGVPPGTSTPRIGNVTPSYISAGSDRPPGSGVAVTFWGVHFAPGCTPEAKVDDTAIELKNVAILSDRISALLLYSDLQGRQVAVRYLSLNLEVTSTTGGVNADTFQLNFTE